MAVFCRLYIEERTGGQRAGDGGIAGCLKAGPLHWHSLQRGMRWRRDIMETWGFRGFINVLMDTSRRTQMFVTMCALPMGGHIGVFAPYPFFQR